MRFKLVPVAFIVILITVAVSVVRAQVAPPVQPQPTQVIQPTVPNPIQPITVSPVQGATSPIAPQGTVITPSQSPVSANVFTNPITVLAPGQTIFVPAGSIVVESTPAFGPGSFITAPVAPTTPATPTPSPLPITPTK